MYTRMVRLAAALALAAVLDACRDAPVALPSHEVTTGGPAFVVGGNAVQPFHFTGNGERASASWSVSDAEGTTYGHLDVSRGRPRDGGLPGVAAATGSTFVLYEITWCDLSDRCQYRYGNGLIPDEDFTGSGAGNLHLRTNTAANPDFYNSGPGGLVVADWRRTGAYVMTRNMTITYRTPAFTLRRQENSSMISATVSGQVLGIVIGPNPQAEMGRGHAVHIEIVRDSVPPLPR